LVVDGVVELKLIEKIMWIRPVVWLKVILAKVLLLLDLRPIK
jgi:hypothetical protein